MAADHLAASQEDDVLVYDRGYPAFWFFALHAHQKRHFCMRVKKTFCAQITQFVARGETDRIVVLRAKTKARHLCRERKLPVHPLPIRLIRVLLESGEIEVLATSLLDPIEYPASGFQELYHLRWTIEETYKRLKSRLEIENFSGKSVLAVVPEIRTTLMPRRKWIFSKCLESPYLGPPCMKR